MSKKTFLTFALVAALGAIPFAFGDSSQPVQCACCGEACTCDRCVCDESGCACDIGADCCCTADCTATCCAQ